MTIKLLIAIFLAFLTGCTTNVAGGSSTTVGNPLVIGTVSVSGKPLANAKVYLLDTNFIPTLTDTVSPILTDENGRFTSTNRAEGVCRVSMIEASGKFGAIGDFNLHGDTVALELQGKKFGTITAVSNETILAVPGTIFRSTGSISLPADTIPSLITIDPKGAVTTIGSEIPVTENETMYTTAGFSWRALSVPVIAGFSEAFESETGTIFIAGNSEIYHKLPGGSWITKEFAGATIRKSTLLNNEIWSSSNIGVIRVTNKGTTIYDSVSTPMISSDITMFSGNDKAITALSGNQISTYDTFTWKSFSISADSVPSVTAVALLDSKAIIGTGAGVLYVSDTNAWVQELIPSLSDPVKWIYPVSKSQVWVGTSDMVVLYDIANHTVIDRLNPDQTIRYVHYDFRSAALWILTEKGLTQRTISGDLFTLTTADLPSLETFTAIGVAAGTNKVLLTSNTSVMEIYGY